MKHTAAQILCFFIGHRWVTVPVYECSSRRIEDWKTSTYCERCLVEGPARDVSPELPKPPQVTVDPAAGPE